MARPKRNVQSKYFTNENDENNNEDISPKKRKHRKSSTGKRSAKTRKCNKKTKSIIDESVPVLNSSNVSEEIMEDDDDDNSDDDWIEVEEAKIFDPEEYKPDLPENIQISLDVTKKTKKQIDWIEAAIRQKINRFIKDNQENMHKCSLLLQINHLQYLNSIIENPLTLALTQSIIDLVPKRKSNQTLNDYLNKFMKWFRHFFTILPFEHDNTSLDVQQEIINSFQSTSIKYSLIFDVILTAFLRLLNLFTRLCSLLNPISKKPKYLFGKKSAKKSDNDETEDNSIIYWQEIFDDKKNKWICCDFKNFDFQQISREYFLNKKITYVLAIDKDNFINDVTCRYAADFISYEFKKRRIDDDWWTKTMDIVKNSNYSKYQDVDKIEFENLVSNVELPKKLSEYKNHPLFVLQRDLLKFQGIYPPDAPPLGFFREQPVFSRNCVQTLKSRETWLRDARTVKLKEQPYKIVQSRFKWKKTSPGEAPEKEMVELFGEWQTEPYKPPKAKNGIVPRNGYGNVDLFKECMLPIGTVYLQLPGLLRVANKLNIDCAPAIVGFEPGRRTARPITGGFVVCKQYESILVEAWHEQQEIQAKKEEENRRLRAYDNWKRLHRGLLIKHNLSIKYAN